ncbi:MAG: hypothetical protein ACOYM2_13005 [Rectinemataceae bacterium]
MQARSIGYTAVLLVMVLGVSCSLLEPRKGNLIIPLPAELLGYQGGMSAADARALVSDQPRQFIRVWLEERGSFKALPGGTKTYYETAAQSTIQIEGISPIRDCSLFIALSVNGGADFKVVKYARSTATFNVAAGVTSVVELEVVDSSFMDLEPQLSDPAGVSALELGGTTYLLANGILHWSGGPVAGLPILDSASSVSRGITRVNGLDAGKVIADTGAFGEPCVWIDTDKGIWILAPDGSAISQLQVVNKAGAPVQLGNILESGTATIKWTPRGDTTTTTMNLLYYQGLGTIGGAFSKGAAWKWFDLSEYTSFIPEALRPAIAEAKSKLLADFAVDSGGEFGYLVIPALNTGVRIGGDTIDTITEELDFRKGVPVQGVLDIMLKGSISVDPDPVSGRTPMIVSIGIAGNRLMVGTDRGVFTTVVAGDGSFAGSLDAISRTLVTSLLRSKQFSPGGPVWTGVLSRNGTVYVLRNEAVYSEWNFYTGIPDFGATGTVAPTGDLFWTDEGLVIAGTNGAVRLIGINRDTP